MCHAQVEGVAVDCDSDDLRRDRIGFLEIAGCIVAVAASCKDGKGGLLWVFPVTERAICAVSLSKERGNGYACHGGRSRYEGGVSPERRMEVGGGW